jgi:hypothetical protein
VTLRLNGSTSGYTEIDAPAVAGSNTLVLPTGNGSSGQVLTTNGSGALSWSGMGPAFSVSTPVNKTAANSTQTEITGYSTPAFDTASCFNVTTGRFTPNVAGYYQFNWSADFGSNGIGAASVVSASLSKNGTTLWSGGVATSSSSFMAIGSSTVAYMNGTTDYASVFVFQNTGSTTSAFLARFAGALIRPA